MNQNPSAPKHLGITLLLALTLGAAALAGCISENAFGEKSPTAVLTVDESENWTGEAFAFNASASSNPNGGITRWHFDFGDGDTFETEAKDEAHDVTHAYKAGGIYNVTLTITDDGTNQTGKNAATDVVVVTVHEQSRIHTRVNTATPGDVGSANMSTASFNVNRGAVSYDGNLTLTNVLVGGTSMVTLRFLDIDGELLEEKDVSVASGEQATAELGGALEDTGTYTLEIIVTSGSVSTGGLMRITYS